MSGNRTAEESLQHSINAMGEPLGRVYHALWNELAWLYAKWGEYVELFGTKPSRIDLVNRAAGEFFRIVQDALWHDALLHITRLTDPPQSVGRDNLTFRRLPPLIGEIHVRQTVEAQIEVARVKSDFCRDWRNRHLAHKDLALAMKDGAEPLKPASRAMVKDALSSICDVLNTVSQHFEGSTTRFEGFGSHRGAMSLLYVLDDGLRVEQGRRERHRAGDFQQDDYKPRDL